MNKYLSITCVTLAFALYHTLTTDNDSEHPESLESVRSETGGSQRVLYGEPQIVVVPMPNNNDKWVYEFVDGLPYWRNMTTGNYLYIKPPR